MTKIGPQADLHSQPRIECGFPPSGWSKLANGKENPSEWEGLREALIRHADADVSDLVGELVGAAGKFVRGTQFEDDVCLVGVNFLVPQPKGRGGLDPGLSREDALAGEVDVPLPRR